MDIDAYIKQFIKKFNEGDFTVEDCLKDGDFTPEFKTFLHQDSIGREYLSGHILMPKEDFVKKLMERLKPKDDEIQSFMKPYIEKFEKETGFKMDTKTSEWRHCNDIAMKRSTLEFRKGGFSCLLCVFEDNFNGEVNADVWMKNATGSTSHWNHIDHHGLRHTIKDYFDDIIKVCKQDAKTPIDRQIEYYQRELERLKREQNSLERENETERA